MYILFCYYQHQGGYVFGQVDLPVFLGQRKKRLDFGDDPEHNPDLGS